MGIILPYSLEYKVYRKDHELENYMLPVAGLDIYCNTPPGQRFDSAIGKIRYLTNELYSITATEIPRTLEDAGLSESDLSEIAKEVSCEEFHEATCFFILEHAFEGKPVTP
jgi:alcohol dehydrogenase